MSLNVSSAGMLAVHHGRGKAGGFGMPVTGLRRFPPLPCALVGWGELGV